MKKLLLLGIAAMLAFGITNKAEASPLFERLHRAIRGDRDDDRRDDDRHRGKHNDKRRGHDRDHRHYDRDDHRDGAYYENNRYGRSRQIYVIERNRPVARVVYVDGRGRYFRVINGERRYVSGRYYTTYPEREYYRDGRPRISITF